MKLSDGRFFDREFGADREACVVNQKTIEEFGIDDYTQTRFIVVFTGEGDKKFMPIIGVCNNFHFESLHSRINPYVMRFKENDNNWGYISVKFNTDTSAAAITQIEDSWKRFASNNPMRYFFMDEDFAHMYKAERQNAKLSVVFAILGIFIAALGLFGLTSFTIEQRTKEVGVRKALGASGYSIFYLISKEIIILVCVATLIASPLVYWVATNWLHNYYYRIHLGVLEFIVGFIAAISIALLTISYKTLQTLRINPAHTLRYE
jgi:putative ABC transport system permease protein